MGTYINRGNSEFRDIVAHEYVDKTSLIPIINARLNSESRYSFVTRCRRFGKSMAAKMLCAYYDKSEFPERQKMKGDPESVVN